MIGEIVVYNGREYLDIGTCAWCGETIVLKQRNTNSNDIMPAVVWIHGSSRKVLCRNGKTCAYPDNDNVVPNHT